MSHDLSERLRAVVDALPLQEGMRVLEIGVALVPRPGGGSPDRCWTCAPSTAHPRDRSGTCRSPPEIEAGRLSFERVSVEDFVLPTASRYSILLLQCESEPSTAATRSRSTCPTTHRRRSHADGFLLVDAGAVMNGFR